MTEPAAVKAARLVATGRVHVWSTARGIVRAAVEGDTGVRDVVRAPTGVSTCSCPASLTFHLTCSHQLALTERITPMARNDNLSVPNENTLAAGAALRTARRAADLTLAGLGAKVGYSGGHVSCLEKGGGYLTDERITEFAAALDIDPAQLDGFRRTATNGFYRTRVAPPRAPVIDVQSDLAKMLSDGRVAAGLSQSAVADRLGVTQPTITRYERDVFMPTLPNLIAMCDMYGIDVEAAVRAAAALTRRWNASSVRRLTIDAVMPSRSAGGCR